MRRIACLLLLAACAHRTQETTHVDVATEVQTERAASSAHESVDIRYEEPTRVTTTTEEYEVGGGTGLGAPLVATPTGPESPAVASSVAPAVPQTGQLLKRTVRVEEHGAVTEERRAESTAAAISEEHVTSRMAVAATKTASTTAGPSPWLVGLGIAVAVVLVALAVFARLGGRW